MVTKVWTAGLATRKTRSKDGAESEWTEGLHVVDLRRQSAVVRRQGLLSAFDRLRVGETLSALDDRDIGSLYYDLAAQRAGEFRWRDREMGPLTWVVLVDSEAGAQKTMCAAG